MAILVEEFPTHVIININIMIGNEIYSTYNSNMLYIDERKFPIEGKAKINHQYVKPNYFKKQSFSSSFVLTYGTGPKWQWSTHQAI